MTATEAQHVALVRAYLGALEAGAERDELAAFFHPSAVQIELPNRLNPSGQRSDLASLLARAEQGRGLLREQRYEVRCIVADGERVAVEAQWSAVLAVPLGTLLPGSTMRADVAMFFEFVEQRISLQRNYDCFDPC